MRAALVALIGAGACAAAAPKGTGGNILFLMCDSMDGRVLDPTSPVSARLEMPNLRKLADEGVNFVRTYTASPQCVPSRTAMFAGRHTHEIKAWSNGQGLAGVASTGGLDKNCVKYYGADTCAAWQREQNVSFTLLDSIREVGYDFEIFGKVDIGGGVLQDKAEPAPRADGFHKGPSLTILTRTADIRKPTKEDPEKITNDNDNNVHPEDWAMFPQCIDFLNGKARSDDKPWLLYCSLNIPHPAFQTNATWLAYVNDDKVDIPAWPEEGAFHPADSYMSIAKAVWRDFTDDEILKVRRTYYAMCAETDFMFGRVLDVLESSGLRETTWVVFLSDHGEMNMEHRQVWKNSMYEASSRVPMIISPPPGVTNVRRGAVVRNLTSLLDVLPTLVDIAQTPVDAPLAPTARGKWFPAPLTGHSLLPLLAKDADAAAAAAGYPADRSIVSQYHSNMGNTGSFMIRSGPWKYIAFGRAAYDSTYTPQLFNVDADPAELSDVATKYADVAASLDATLREVVDVEAIDAAVRTNDVALYKQYFASKSADMLRKEFKAAYRGFDDADMAKVEAWVANGGE